MTTVEECKNTFAQKICNPEAHFSSKQEAYKFLEIQIRKRQKADVTAGGHVRVAYCDNDYEMDEYWRIYNSNCCGSADYCVTVKGTPLLIGFSFGH